MNRNKFLSCESISDFISPQNTNICKSTLRKDIKSDLYVIQLIPYFIFINGPKYTM